MSESYQHIQNFDKIDFSAKEMSKEYESCAFNNCNFLNSDLSKIKFIDCTFENCNFSRVKIYATLFRDVHFKNCKLLGLTLDDCNELLLSMSFNDCQLSLASFYKLSLKNTTFENCNLKEADFTESDLTHSTFSNCDLAGAVFKNTILKNVDFRTSYHFSIDPEINQIKKAKFSMPEIVGLLDKYDIEIE
ncbi:MAG TPA: pentapeptide repeat-containing protein [Balneolaceae bacterium]|nr:pentapeptide repeat-containing protein [Balneolaceae bacterium]